MQHRRSTHALPATTKIYSKLPSSEKTITRFAFNLFFFFFFFASSSFLRFQWANSERDRIQPFDPLLRVNAPALNRQHKHHIFSPSAQAECVCVCALFVIMCVYAYVCLRCTPVHMDWCERSSTRYTLKSKQNVCKNLHPHSNAAAGERKLLNANKNGNGQWDQQAAPIPSLHTTMAPFTVSWAKKRAHIQSE